MPLVLTARTRGKCCGGFWHRQSGPIVSVAIYVFIITWNRFIWPLLVGGGDPASYTMTVAVHIHYNNPESGANWGNLMAASVVSTLPIMVMYFALRKQILRTFTEGAVKG